MKKLILTLVAVMTMSIAAFSQHQNYTVRYPFGAADNITPAYDDTLTVTINNTVTYLKPGTLTGNMLLNFSTNSEIKTGALVYMQFTGSAARTVTFSTGFTSPALSIDSAKTHIQTFFYDGSKWKPIGAAIKIN